MKLPTYLLHVGISVQSIYWKFLISSQIVSVAYFFRVFELNKRETRKSLEPCPESNPDFRPRGAAVAALEAH